MRAAIYARYSAGPRQTDQSIEGQVRVNTEFCNKKGLTIVGEYCDRHISGKTDARPEFQRLIADAKLGKFDCVVVYKTDRFARNKYDSAIYKRELKRCGVQIFYSAETIPEGPEGIILESLMEGLAEYYSVELAQKIRRGMHESALKAQTTGSGRPLGYKVDKNKRFVIDPEGAEAVRIVFSKFNEGASSAEICQYLNERGFRTVQGNDFNKNSINRIIKNRKYIGEYRFQDVVIKDGMPRIVSDDVFNLAQREMEKRKRHRTPKSPKAEYLLSGKLFCGTCKSAMQGISGTGKSGQKWYYYVCPNNRAKTGCKKKRVPRNQIEALVVDLTIKYILQEDTLAEIARRLFEYNERQSHTEETLDLFKKKLADNKKAINNILKVIEAGTATKSLPERLQQLEDEQEVILGEIAYLQEKHVEFSEDQILFMLMKYLDPFENETEQDYQRRIISCFVSEVYLYDDKIRIFFNINSPDGTLASVDLAKVESGDAEEVFDLGLVSSTNLIQSRTQKVEIVILAYGFVLTADLQTRD